MHLLKILPVHDVYAEYMHFADVSANPLGGGTVILEKLLRYGPTIAEHTPTGLLVLVTPALALSPPGHRKQQTLRTTVV